MKGTGVSAFPTPPPSSFSTRHPNYLSILGKRRRKKKKKESGRQNKALQIRSQKSGMSDRGDSAVRGNRARWGGQLLARLPPPPHDASARIVLLKARPFLTGAANGVPPPAFQPLSASLVGGGTEPSALSSRPAVREGLSNGEKGQSAVHSTRQKKTAPAVNCLAESKRVHCAGSGLIVANGSGASEGPPLR
ncbi:hypothetical protein SKAU_G00204620 [Synaphobranchus kaupii]|uniref:Uncharacterized protein n=1 Tax=Synaphobranchus kaupii TaxID=118154 RepID=A0A9Q1IYJ2_SYNKA|nr:hypothetical protein SKAU_G00204620 [Synaphobranchus kaupii]